MNEMKRKWIVFIGDVFCWYVALGVSAALRGADLESHLLPFSILFVLWSALFYIGGLYRAAALTFKTRFLSIFVKIGVINVLLSAAFFYFFAAFGITPKTNLLLFTVLYGVFMIAWRFFAAWMFSRRQSAKQVVFIGLGIHALELSAYLRKYAAIGYTPVAVFQSEEAEETFCDGVPVFRKMDRFNEVLREKAVTTVVVHESALEESPRDLYRLLGQGIEVVDAVSFWEEIREEIPIHVTSHSWFLRTLRDIQKTEHEMMKRAVDIVFSLSIAGVLCVIIPGVALAVRLSSRGPVFFRQVRVGRRGKTFTLYKFRTMYIDAEKNGAQWSTKNDPRVTPLGRILRHTHLDEVPQLWNILCGDVSLVGPRPERPEFVEKLEKEIPHYALRHLVKPGLTGWAQINYPYGASVEDSARKLAYDLYYVKHRTLILDMKILLRTVAHIFKGEGR